MSRFQTVPINIAGGTNKNRSRSLNSQRTVNFYPEQSEGGKSPFVLQSFPGQTAFGAAGFSGIIHDNGAYRMNERMYRVISGILFLVLDTGVHVSKKTLISQVGDTNPIKGKVSFADDGANLVMVFKESANDTTVAYSYIEETETLIPLNTSPFDEANSVAYLNNQFLYFQEKFWFVSNVGDPTTINGLNGAGAESYPDKIVRGYVFNQFVYILGERTTEVWYNSGVGKPPFERVQGRIFNVGLGAKESIANNDSVMYWLGDDRKIYATTGGQAEVISTVSVTSDIESFDVVDDAVGFTFTFENQNFYAITFPTAGKTWCMSEGLGKSGWFELSSDANFENDGKIDGIYNVFTAIECYGKILMPIINSDDGGVNYLDVNAYSNGVKGGISKNLIRRNRTLAPITGDIAGVPGKRMQMSRFELICEKGVGNISGAGVDPKIMIEASYDGGKTFGHGTWMKIGRLGDNSVRAEWFSLKSFYELTIRITTSDPVLYSLHAAAMDIRVAGR
tara:strand:+ start:2941 stop:4461 length:1521 start_codon:yes stop_codon:yes gene_type:complete